MLRPNTGLICEELDATVFSGDEFMENEAGRLEFERYIHRWLRGLREFRISDQEARRGDERA